MLKIKIQQNNRQNNVKISHNFHFSREVQKLYQKNKNKKKKGFPIENLAHTHDRQ